MTEPSLQDLPDADLCLGDRVWVGAHATLVGGTAVGDDALIAPGACVKFDVPASAVVRGNPGQIVPHKGSAAYTSRTIPGTAPSTHASETAGA